MVIVYAKFVTTKGYDLRISATEFRNRGNESQREATVYGNRLLRIIVDLPRVNMKILRLVNIPVTLELLEVLIVKVLGVRETKSDIIKLSYFIHLANTTNLSDLSLFI